MSRRQTDVWRKSVPTDVITDTKADNNNFEVLEMLKGVFNV